MIASLFKGLWSLVPSINWKRQLSRHGLPLVAAGVLLYEVAIPLRDEVIASGKDMRAALLSLAGAFQDVGKAKLDDSVNLARLTLLFEAERDRRRAELPAGDDLTRSEAHLR